MVKFLNQKESVSLIQEATIMMKHVALRPTKLAISLLVLSIAIWIGAANYQVNVAYAVCFWVVGFVGVSALLTYRQLLGLQIELTFTGEVFAGQTADVLLCWRTGEAKRSRLLWWRGEYQHHCDEQWQRIDMSANLNIYEAIWAIPIERRGYFPPDLCIKLATSAPFGLFHGECCLVWKSEAIAFAAPLLHSDFGNFAKYDSKSTPQQTGAHGDEIAYLKNHQQGTSLQQIAWKVYAKRNELMDRVFDEPPPVKHSQIISYRDYPQGMHVDKLASLLTYRVLQADKFGTSYTLELPNRTIAPQNGLREKCLTALALM